MKRMTLRTATGLACLLCALSCAAHVSAATITIASTTVAPTTTYPISPTSTATLRIYSNVTFTAADGSIVMAGTPGTGAFYKSVTCTISAGVITIPSFTLTSTTDSVDNQTALYTAVFFDAKGVRRDVFLADFPLPLSLGLIQTWAKIRVHKAGKKPLPDTTVYTRPQTDAQIQLATQGIYEEVPSGSVNGVNQTFTVSRTPVAGSDEVFLNGVRQYRGNLGAGTESYTISGAIVTHNLPPQVGDRLTVAYRTASGLVGTNIANQIQESSDPAVLTVGPIADGTYLKRSGTTVTGGDPVPGVMVECGGVDDTAVLAAVNAAGQPIVIPAGKTCATTTATYTVPMRIEKGGILKPLTSNTATLAIVEAGDYQIFAEGFGTIAMTGPVDYVNVAWFGPANAANSSAAISAALDSVINAVSPSATLYFPSGRWVIGTPIVKNLATATKQSQVIIEGNGSTTNLVLGVTSSQAALTLQNGHKIVIRNMAVVGNGTITGGSGANWVLWRGIAFSNTLQAVIENVEFYGIASNVVANGAVIHATNTHLTLRDVAFRSCSGGVGVLNGAITVTNWNELSVENFHFIDFGVLNGVYYGSPDISFGIFQLGNVAAPTVSSYSGGYASFKNIVTDEGTWNVLTTYITNGSTIQSITIDNWRANIALSHEFSFNGVKNIRISNSKIAYAAAAQTENLHPGIYAENVDTLEVKNTQLLGPYINSIWLGANVRYTRVVDSIVQRITNPNCSIVDEITAGERKPQVPCNAMAERAGSSAVKHYFNATTGKSVVSFDGHPPVPIHGGKSPTLLADSFTETAITAASWDSTSSTNVTPTQVGNRLQFTAASGSGADTTPGKYTSDNTYDFSKNGIVSVYLPTVPSSGATGSFNQILYVMAADGVTPIYYMFIDSGSNGQIVMVDDAGSSANPIAYAPYWRIRYESGFVYFEISPSNSNWTTIRTSTTSAAITNVKFVLAVSAWNTVSPVTVHPTFDEFRFSQYYAPLIADDGLTLTLTSPKLPNGGELRESMLSTTTLINMNSGATQVLYTCPTGKTCVVTKVIVRNASASLTTASYSFQWNTADDVIVNATHTELTSSTLYTQLLPKVGAAVGSTGATFDVLMNTLQGSGATTTMDVFGYTY